jgi:tRNA-guanine family transglycosylase
MVCKQYTRAYLHTLAGKEALGSQLLTYHNIAYQMNLMRSIRKSIMEGKFPEFVVDFMKKLHPNGNYPKWAVDALNAAG